MVKLIGAIAASASLLLSSVSAQDAQNVDSEVSPQELETASTPPPDYFDKDKYQMRTVVCPFKGEVKYKPGEISCSVLEVPENREKARPRTIDLHVTKIHARMPETWDEEADGEWRRRDDPIIYLTGGPGVKAQGYVDRLKDHKVRDVRDLYILEQRGIGWSSDFCPAYPLFDPSVSNTQNWDQYQRSAMASAEDCFSAAKAARVDLSGYNSIENARDVKALRRALGIEQWNVWGISYGSILGQAYLKQDPEGIRAAVIDAIVPLQQDITFHHIARYYDRSLTILEQACGENLKCNAAFPDFKQRLKQAILRTAMKPIELDAIDQELFPSGKAYLFQDIVGGAPFSLFYEQDNYATLPAFIDAFVSLIEKGDHDALRIITAGAPSFAEISQGMYNAIACNDNWFDAMKIAMEEDFGEFPALSMVFGDPALIDEQIRLCRNYGMTPRNPEDYLAVQTSIPSLIVEGQMDPITPPPLAKTILPGFENGTYIEFPFAGHGPTRSVECAGEMLTGFYDDPAAEVDMSCPESMSPPDFAGPLFKTDFFARFGALAAEDEKQLAAPVVWLGASTAILVFSFIIYTIAPIARLINGAPGHGTIGARPLGWITALLGVAAAMGLGYGAYASYEANNLILLVGMLGWTRWFAIAGIAAGVTGLLTIWRTVVARAATPLPVGVLMGLLMTGLAGVGLAAFLISWGPRPF